MFSPAINSQIKPWKVAKTKKKLVVLLGFAFTLKYLEQILNKEKGAIFLVDQPYCCELLEKLEQPYITVEDFVSSDQLSSMGDKNYDILDQLCNAIDSSLYAQVKEQPDSSFYVSGLIQSYYFTLKRIVDCVCTANLLGQSISNNLSPDFTYIYTDNAHPVPYKSNCQEFYGHHFVQTLKIAIKGEVVVVNVRKVYELLGIRVLIKNYVRYVRDLILILLNALRVLLLNNFISKKIVLFTGINADVLPIYHHIKANSSMACVQFNPSNLSVGILRFLVRIFKGKASLPGKKNLILKTAVQKIKDVNLPMPKEVLNPLKDAIENIIIGSYIKNLLSFRIGEALTKSYSLIIAISNCITTSTESCFLLGVSNGGGKTCHYQHGGGQGYLEKRMSAWFNSQTDIFFCYGQVVRDHQPICDKVAVFPVGSPRLNNIRNLLSMQSTKKRCSNQLNLICVPSGANGYRAYYPEVKRSDMYRYFLWKNITDRLVTMNKELDNRFVITIKTDSISRSRLDFFSYIRSREWYNQMHIINEGSLANLLDKVDIILLDQPETTLLEAMLTNKPIILYYDGSYKFENHSRELLMKRIFLVNNIDELYSTLRHIILNYKDCINEKSDNSFLDYCLSETKPPAFLLSSILSGHLASK